MLLLDHGVQASGGEVGDPVFIGTKLDTGYVCTCVCTCSVCTYMYMYAHAYAHAVYVRSFCLYGRAWPLGNRLQV